MNGRTEQAERLPSHSTIRDNAGEVVGQTTVNTLAWANDVDKNRGPTSDAVEILRRLYVDGQPGGLREMEEIRADARVAREIYDLSTRAGLTQRDLAKLVGTSASVICRLEDADYEGHSLAMLRRIATALGMTVEIRLVPAKK